MANILVTDNTGLLYYVSGAVPSASVPTPPGVTSNPLRPSSRVYQGRRYIVGQYTPGVCLDEYHNFTPMGILPPPQTPTLTAVGPLSGAGITGNVIGYITFAYKVGSVVIAESNPGASTPIVTLTGQARQWTLIPTIATNPKVNTVRGWVSVAGGVPALAWERPLGVLSVTEQTPNTQLAGGPFLPVDTQGNLTLAAGLPPPAAFMEIYHDRAWYNDPTNPDYIWYSEIGLPESVGALNFLRLRDREPVSGIARVNDVLAVFGQTVTYDLLGYTSSDFNLRKLTSSIGCIANASIRNINEVLWFFSQDGCYTFNGATFRFMMRKLATFFRTQYLANRALYENGFAEDDKYDHLYKFLIPITGASASNPNYYVCHYDEVDPSMSGSYGAAPGAQAFGVEPIWSFDNRARTDFVMLSAVAPGTSRADFFVAGSDGIIRQENIETDATDDGDTGNKTMLLTHGHNLLRKPDGDMTHGKTFYECDVFATFESAAGTINIWTGDESAATAPTTRAFSETLGPTFIAGQVPLEDHFFRPHVSGRGYTLQVSVPLCLGNEYRGHGMLWGPAGPQSRTPNV